VTGECKNCGAQLAGRYCSACGQAADVGIPSFGRVAADAIGDLYNVDSRMWRSLLTLVRQPGRLTNLYLEGKRASYTPPFRLYAASSIAFFLLLSLFQIGGDGGADEGPAASDDPPVAGAPAPAEPAVPPAAERGSIYFMTDEDGWSCNFVDEDTDPQLRARLEAACEKIEQETGASLSRAVVDNVPIMMLVFIPLVAGLMRLLYLFTRRKYVEHLVFFLHVHAFFFVTAIAVMVVSGVAGLVPWLRWPVLFLSIGAWLYFPVYVYRAMRHVYRQGHALTAVKYVSLGFGYFVALLITLFGLFFFTVATL
jgi:hypothetical protein